MHNRDIIFVWIPKNAGSTVAATLTEYLGLRKQKYPPKKQILSGNYTFVHQSWSSSFQKDISKSYVDNAPNLQLRGVLMASCVRIVI